MFVRILLSRSAMMAYFFVATGMLLIGSQRAGAQEPAASDIAWDVEDGDAEHLMSGPMHEAFAAPVPFDPEPGLVVPAEPPEPIDEIPPDIQPDDDAVWLEGYWAWDDEREDFVWVSGVYRVPPVGRRWVPGYWEEVPEGYQWVSGFWAPLNEQEVTYLPDPPESQERGPTSPAPSDDHFWASGHWYHQDGRYVWRPGYWAPGHEQWVWVPAHYVWTPRGYVFVSGYWDYRFVDRGMAFAPVYWRRPVYARAGFYYRPFRVIDLARLHLHWFVRPRYRHYYYGDWYGRPAGWGIHASFAFHGRYGYDPLWSYYRWHFRRRGIDYHARVRGWHRYFDRHVDRRPPRTWRHQRDFARRRSDYQHLRRVVLGHDLRDYAARHRRRVRQVAEPDRRRMRDTARAMREVRDVRRRGERDRQPGRFRLPETPDVRRQRDRMARGSPDRRPPDTRRPDRRPDVRRPDRRETRRPTTPSHRPETRRPTPSRRPEARPSRGSGSSREARPSRGSGSSREARPSRGSGSSREARPSRGSGSSREARPSRGSGSSRQARPSRGSGSSREARPSRGSGRGSEGRSGGRSGRGR